jgi:hypothetical protein
VIINIRGYSVDIDKEDYEIANHPSWYPLISDHRVYFTRSISERKTLLLHRVIMSAPKGVEVDHRDGNTLNCKKRNLRLCDHFQNQRNMRKGKSNKSGYKGVSWRSRYGKWRAVITDHGRHIELGLFDDPKIAHEAYKKAALKIAGEFARW